MPSKQVTDREKSAVALLAIVEGQLEALLVAYAHALSPQLAGGESLPDLGLTCRLASRSLQQALTTLKAADQANIDEQNDDVPIIEARDATAQQLSERLIKLRQAASVAYGSSSLVSLGFASQTPQDQTALVRFARGVVAAFRKGNLPEAVEGVSFDPKSRLEVIEKDAGRLDALLQEMAKERREAQKTQDDKNKAMASYDETFSRVANFFVGVFRLAGLSSLAKKVRPSTRRPGQLIEEDEYETTNS